MACLNETRARARRALRPSRVFVLTHHPREPLAMRGGTTFTFVNDGIQAAVEQARERLVEDVGDPTLEPVKVVASPAVTHVKYRVGPQRAEQGSARGV
jgi:hypothetical protein